MRLVLLTVEGKGLSLEIQKKATSGARDHGEIAEREKKRIKTKSGGTRRRRKKRRRHQEVERSENYSQGISLEHPPRRRAVVGGVRGEGERSESEESGPAFLCSPFVLSYSRSFRAGFSFCFHARSVPRGMR